MEKTSVIKKPFRFLFSIFLANLLVSFHLYIILYVNSSFLEEYFSPTFLSFLFILGALINLALLLSGSALIKRFSNYKLTLFLIFLEFIAVFGLAFAQIPFLVALFFVIHQATIMMILFNMDIFLEDYSPSDESQTGGIRGAFLTVSNLTLVISPSLAGFILTNGGYWKVYLFSALFLIPMFFVVRKGLKFKISNMNVVSSDIKQAIASLRKNKDIYNALMTQFILQFFYAWMVIYMPIHLHQNLGFPWSKIGIIFTIMLLPFVLFEIPLGRLADKKTGEKEILIIGFTIIALATAFIPFVNNVSLIFWAGILFATRVGASFVEIGSESYFFKHVNAGNTDIISLFRITRPLALIAAPAIAVASLYFVNAVGGAYQFIFAVLAAITLLGIKYSLAVTDTR